MCPGLPQLRFTFVCVCEIHWKMVWMSLTICLNCQRIKVAVSAWQTGLEPKWRALLPLASLWLSSVPRCSFIPRVSLSPPFRLGLPFLTPVSPPLWLRHPPARPPAFDSTQRPPTDEPTGHPFPWLPTTGTVSLLRLSHHPPATHRQSYQRRVPVANFRHFGQNGTHGPDRRRCAVTALSSASLCFSRLRCFLVFIFFSLLLPSTALVPLGG